MSKQNLCQWTHKAAPTASEVVSQCRVTKGCARVFGPAVFGDGSDCRRDCETVMINTECKIERAVYLKRVIVVGIAIG